MSPKVKDRIISGLISAAGGAISVIFAFKLSTKDLNAREINKKIDSKVDKIEFVEYKTDHEKKHDREAEVNKEFRSWLKDEMKGLRQDMRELINKP